MLKAKVTQKGQVTIPKKIRDWLQIQPQDEIIFIRRGEEVVIKRVNSLLGLQGSVSVQSEQDFDAVREQVRKKIAHRTGNE